MTNTKVSILVPIYNTEKYLRQCLDSLTQQTLKEIEIICINDGSTDESLKIIKEYAKKDPRFVVINKKNSGYGDSMNRGLAKAKGEYVGILEPDDFIEHDAYEKMYEKACNFKADIARANYFHYLKNKDTIQRIIPRAMVDKVSDPLQDQFIFMAPPAIWSAIYRRDLLERYEIKFLPTPGASYQDAGFGFKALSSAKRVVYLDEAFLHYRRDNEASSVHQTNKVMCVHDEFSAIEEFLKKHRTIKTLCDVMERAKFRTYCWNLTQLSPELAKDFLKVIRDEFREAEIKYPNFLSTFNAEEKIAYKMIMNLPQNLIVGIFKCYRAVFYGKY